MRKFLKQLTQNIVS